ncbi:MAG TPA: DUF2752 domain-containing protein [Actinomycetota bacterium]|nr:DUF2752 domain-containing protein [Actinomycetota bacterium]
MSDAVAPTQVATPGIHVFERISLTAGAFLGAAALYPLVPHPDLICPLRATTGIPCPLCGMTTSVTATVHGDIGAALAANPAGVLAVAVAGVLLVSRRARALRVPPLLWGLLLAGMWLFELFRFSIL